MATTEVIHAYRNLYRGLLHAVQFSTPARYVARDQLRVAFREEGARLDERGIKRTLWFLDAAAKETGLEHKILKNLLRMSQARYKMRHQKPWRVIAKEAERIADKDPEK
jgi:hypothetical protein